MQVTHIDNKIKFLNMMNDLVNHIETTQLRYCDFEYNILYDRLKYDMERLLDCEYSLVIEI